MRIALGDEVEQICKVKKALALLLISSLLAPASPVIDDRGLRERLQKALAAVANRKDHVSGKDLALQLKEARESKAIEIPPRPASDGKMNYDDEVKGVVMLGSVYKCDKCEKWHLGGVTTAWVLAEDGLMVTNHHVLDNPERETYGVMTLDGKFAEITKVVSSDPAADIGVFRVEGDGFEPLVLAKELEVGERVHVISHPDGHFFTYTAGRISRLYKKTGGGRPTTWMSITADYAKGSSGGPVLNDRGEVVGMVSSTSSVYYGAKASTEGKEKGPLQMVIKNCVSLPELRRLLAPESKSTKPGE